MRPSRVTRPPRGTRLETRPGCCRFGSSDATKKESTEWKIARVLPFHRKSTQYLDQLNTKLAWMYTHTEINVNQLPA